MTFFRPEIHRTLRKWAEPIVMLVILLLALWMYFHAEARANAPLQVIAVLLTAAAAALLVLSVRRVRLHTDKRGFGMVEVQERKIIYYGPDTGGAISLDDLTKVEIVATHATGYIDVTYWQLTDQWGSILIIPLGAEGSDAMLDSFAALPGVDYDLIVTAMSATDNAVFTIWKKTG